ncbi:MAG: GNAT family N-acetyltransferase [Deltaproteobacteria bacterium]|nr:GNAT family N-acetyltransferase [Deltaproteobacteria bacterium]
MATIWSALADSSRHSIFLLPESVEVWLETFGEELDPTILIFREPDRTPIGACLLIRRTMRKGPFLLRRVYLNTAGEDDADSACIEFNEFVCKPGHEPAIALALRAYLDDNSDAHPWDELVAAGMLEGPSLDALRIAFSDGQEVEQAKKSYFVDLNAVRSSGKGFVETLSSRERTRCRQNVRKYSELGDLDLREASTVEEAVLFLDALAALHQKTWTSRGMPGSFASKRFYDYHRRLVRRSFPLGRIQLVRLSAGNTTIGYHYAFVVGDTSYFYQCGYDYHLGEKTSPGVTLHAAAIQHSLAQGLARYDFMAGDVEYKRRMGTGSRLVHWISWQAPTMKMKSFDFVRQAKRLIRSRSHEVRAALTNSLRTLAAPYARRSERWA